MTLRAGRKTRVAVLFDRVPRALVANLNASAQLLDVTAVEALPESNRDARATRPDELFRRLPVAIAGSGADLGDAIHAALTSVQPEVVVLLGWSEIRDLSGLGWCIEHTIPAVVASDSNASDFARRWWKEAAKRQVVRVCSAAWSAGTRSAEYLRALGMPAERVIIGPVDTIDVQHFSGGASSARQNARSIRVRLALPDRYFFASSRFAPEKNLFGLLDAYARYRALAGSDAWRLVVAGDGLLGGEVRQRVSALQLDESVKLLGWVAFQDLPAFYGLASAFVHASTREPWGVVVNEAMAASLPVIVSNACGSAPDLVREGVNGFTFDPLDHNRLAELMLQVAHGTIDREEMGRASRTIIEGWTPDRYAESLRRVVGVALSAPRPLIGLTERAVLRVLVTARRP